jgi:antitoxin component of MazEF toxin-antitoxin module
VGKQTVIRIPAAVREYYHLDKIKEILLKPVNDKELLVEF